MPYSTEIQVRFRDLDSRKHVNNALYVTYLEQVRAEFYAEVLGAALADLDVVLAQLEVSYEQAIEDIGAVTVELTVDDVGQSSIEMEYRIHSDGQQYATGRTVQVYVDPDTGDPSPLPDRYRDRFP